MLSVAWRGVCVYAKVNLLEYFFEWRLSEKEHGENEKAKRKAQ
jgi:hypothetical protein